MVPIWSVLWWIWVDWDLVVQGLGGLGSGVTRVDFVLQVLSLFSGSFLVSNLVIVEIHEGDRILRFV